MAARLKARTSTMTTPAERYAASFAGPAITDLETSATIRCDCGPRPRTWKEVPMGYLITGIFNITV